MSKKLFRCVATLAVVGMAGVGSTAASAAPASNEAPLLARDARCVVVVNDCAKCPPRCLCACPG